MIACCVWGRGRGGGGKDVVGNRVPGIYLEIVGLLCQCC